MNVLVTGAGLIGAHLARRAADAGDRVVLFDLSPNRDYIRKIVGEERAEIVAADLRDLPALLSALDKFSVDTIVHTAGLIGKRVAENSYTGATNNILGTIHVLEAARLRRLKRVVYVSTFGVYDRSKIDGRTVRETDAVGGHNLYTTTKACSEHLVHAYTEQYSLDSVIIRPAGVFGRGHYVGGSTVGMVMRDLALNILKRESFAIDAEVYAANEYVYAKDVALALHLACNAVDPKQRIYNAGSGVVTDPEDMMRIVRALAPGIEVRIAASGGAEKSKRAPLDLSRSKAEIGYISQFPLKEALRDYMDELRTE